MKWQTPPDSARGRISQYPALAEELTQRRGEWALIKEGASASGNDAKKNLAKLGAFEVTSRTIPGAKPARYQVYARAI